MFEHFSDLFECFKDFFYSYKKKYTERGKKYTQLNGVKYTTFIIDKIRFQLLYGNKTVLYKYFMDILYKKIKYCIFRIVFKVLQQLSETSLPDKMTLHWKKKKTD